MRAIMLAALASTVCGSAFAQGLDDFNRVVVFGDSLTDAGTYGARFTTNPDLVATQLLAQQYGSSTLPAVPLGLPPNADAWIYGAGGVGVTSPRLGAGLYVTQQVDAFLAASTPGARDLVVLQGGPNDVFVIAAGLTPGGEAAAQAAIEAEATALTAQLDRLSGAGLILMLNMPNISATPLGALSSPAARQNFDLLVNAFNTVLYDEVAARSGDILVLDTFGFIDAVVADPARFGFANAMSPACTVGSALSCTTATLVAPGAEDTYFFGDAIHPTGAGHQAFADYAASVLDAPNRAVSFGRSLIGAADGDRAVASAALNDARAAGHGGLFGGLTGQAGDDADGIGVLIGLTRPAGEGGAYGAMFSFETGEGDAPGLEHDVQSFRLTGFVGAPISERVSVSGRLSGVYLNIDDVTRRFAIYGGAISEAGDTEAFGYAAAVRIAYDLSDGGPLSHGLFGEISHESLDIDDYAEAGASPFALEFGDQELRRTLGVIGYQVRYGGQGFAPFASAAYVEPLDSDAGDVSVSLVNTPGIWSVNAPDFDDDGYARLEAGFTTPAWSNARLMVVASGEFQDDHESARVLVGLTREF